MRICLLGQYPPHIGGVASHTYLLSQKLVERGDEVIVLTYPHLKVQDNGRVKVLSAWTPNIKGLRGFFFIFSAFFKLIILTKQHDLELLHAHFVLPPGLVAVLVNVFMGRKTAVTIHGSDIFILAQKPVLKQITRWVLSKTNYVIVVNSEIKQKVEEMGINPEKIYLTSNAVDIQKFNPQNHLPADLSLKPDKKSILFVGNLVHQKGLEYLLEAKKQIKSDCELLIVGNGPLREPLGEKVEDEEIPDVTFLGERRDVELIMPSADLFVLPSISEGSPITILEALASGLPVVATDVGGVGGIMTPEVGRIVAAYNSSTLAQAVDEILSDDKLRTKMGKNCREKAREYDYIKIPY